MYPKLNSTFGMCAAALGLSTLLSVGTTAAATVTAVEFYNTALDAYFITGRASEQTLLDTNASFRRTGMSFAATSIDSATATQSRICRFYVSAASPFVSSHFYGSQGSANQTYDCEWLRANTPTGFSFEGYDFAVNAPVSTVCAAGTYPVYLGFRALSAPNNGKTSNHRYTTSSATYATAGANGYQPEGVQFCASAATDVSTTTAGSDFTLTSTPALNGGTLPSAFTCDGANATPPLAWVNAPAGTNAFAVLMTTLAGDGSTKWNWLLYNVPATTSGLAMNTSGVGALGAADDGAGNAYAPPCSQGPGAKTYTFTVYALASPLVFSQAASLIKGQVVIDAIERVKLASAALNVSYTRTTAAIAASAINCAQIQTSTAAYGATVAVDCTASDYGKIASRGMANHVMMNGIAATNLQVPIPQKFVGTNAWKIPLLPSIAATPTLVNDGPVGVAINGVPIFNPCKQGGCQNGDTKVLGELDVCNGHAGRADDYHYHAAPTCLMADQPAHYWDTHPLGWALDGFAIFGYNDATGSTATRDAICGGNTLTTANAPTGYSYHVTDTAPYVMSCLRGTPSPDLAGQGAKYTPFRQPPVTPFPVTNMTLTTDATDGFQVLQFSSSRSFQTTETGTDSYANAAGSYRIRYQAISGTALTTLLAQTANANKTECWTFQFTTSTGTLTQPTTSYCR